MAVAVATASAAALAVATSTWVAAMPSFVARWLANVVPVVSFELPLALPAITLSQTWHPRSERDPAHRVLRAGVAELARRQPRGAAAVVDARPR